MKSIATFLSGYLVVHILLISLVEAYFCVPLKLVSLGFIFLVFGIAVANSKKIIIEKSDIVIVFLLAFLNIYYALIGFRGLVYFYMTYVLFLAIILSKVILPNISLKRYLAKINTIYLIVLIGLVIEYLILIFIGDAIFIDLFMCSGETGVRGYIPFHNITSEILPYNITGLNSILLGSQTAPQLTIIIFIWYLYKYKVNKEGVYMALGLLAFFMSILSPTLTSLLLLLTTIVIINLINLISTYKEEIRNYYKVYIAFFITVLSIYILVKLFTYRYSSIANIYELYILENLLPFAYLDLNEVLFGATYERRVELFGVGEIALLDHLLDFGVLGMGVFYISVFYYIIRALDNRNVMALTPNIFILVIFILGNLHYQVMFGLGVLELFVLHLAYIIYHGSSIKK